MSYLDRDLTIPGQKLAIKDLIQSIFVAELISPSKTLWIGSGWISDIEMIDNRSRQFMHLCPEWPASWIRFTNVLQSLVERGGKVVLILRDEKHNYTFIDKVNRLNLGESIKVIVEGDFHEKGIVGDDYCLSGSMNFTFSGIQINDEHVTYRCDPQVVHERLIVMREKWGESL